MGGRRGSSDSGNGCDDGCGGGWVVVLMVVVGIVGITIGCCCGGGSKPPAVAPMSLRSSSSDLIKGRGLGLQGDADDEDADDGVGG
jgi:hypothetical protein